jgi:hypothetical protein
MLVLAIVMVVLSITTFDLFPCPIRIHVLHILCQLLIHTFGTISKDTINDDLAK